ncbi:MAG: PAS domain S-box protein [Deltaproteobacteria bacterium]|nr:PAS domain S-box protein [Deltaproteobacteria bacterium]
MKRGNDVKKPKPHQAPSERDRDPRFLQKLLDSIPIPIFYKDTRGVYLGGNRAFGDFLGRKMEDIVGKTVRDIAPGDLASIYERADQELFQTGGVQTYEGSMMHADGTRHDVIFYKATLATFLNRNGSVGGLIGSLFDITDRKRAEETLIQREEELSIKTRNLQEVNTALKVLLKQREDDRSEMEENVLTNVKTTILPYLEKVKEGPLTRHQRASLEILEAQIKKIISPFLHRISQPFFDLTPQEVRVADFVKNGNTTKEIADILGISIKTVDYHRDNIRRKLGIKNHHTNLRSFLLKLS